MQHAKPETRLRDILIAIDRVRAEVEGLTLDAFETDWRKQWLVERGLLIVSEASRHLPPAMKSRHPHIPWRRVAGIGNVLRHDYESIATDVLWRVTQEELTPLEAVCRAELAALPPSSE